MQIAARRGDVAVAKSALNLREGSTAIDGMVAIGMPQPVGRYRFRSPSLVRYTLHHAVNSAFGECAALAAGEDAICRVSIRPSAKPNGFSVVPTSHTDGGSSGPVETPEKPTLARGNAVA